MADDATRINPADDLAPERDDLPAAEELPPVKPPSAGFIVQLFVVPALIVLAIVGVIGLFGQLSQSEQDWRELVQELGSTNEHRRWRAALGLAYLLKADQERPAGERRLTDNPRVAQALVKLLDEQLARRSSRDDDVKQQAFVARTLGWLDVPDSVLPALQRAMQPGHDREVRKNALSAMAVIFGRSAAPSPGAPSERLEALVARPGLVDDLIEVSHDADPLIRQLAAYTLGLAPAGESQHRLEVLLNDADPNTQINAALGLARQHSPAGWPVFRRVLNEASGSGASAGMDDLEPGPEANTRQNESQMRLVAVSNSLKAAGDLAGKWSPAQREELLLMLRRLADDHAEVRIRTDARQALIRLYGGAKSEG